MNESFRPRRSLFWLEPEMPESESPHRKGSPANPDEDALIPAVGGPAPEPQAEPPNPLHQQITPEERVYLESLPARSLAEEIKLMRVLSRRLVQKGHKADNSADEIRYYSEATRIMARLPLLLKAEKALQASQDDVAQAMVQAINTVLEQDRKNRSRQLELPFQRVAASSENMETGGQEFQVLDE